MTDPTPTPPPLDLAALTVIANAATPGPWEARQGIAPGKKVVGPRESGDILHGPIVLMKPIFWDKRSAANADHIAAFDPPTVLHLIARLENAEALYLVRHDHVLAAEEERNQWRARAEVAEAKTAAVRALAGEWESSAGPGSRNEDVFGKQVVSVEFAVKHIRAALDGTA